MSEPRSSSSFPVDPRTHVEYDVDILPWYLKITESDDKKIVDACLGDINYQNLLTSLKYVVNARQRDEIDMYEPLCEICRFIESRKIGPPRKAFRRVLSSQDLHPVDATEQGLPIDIPDLMGVDIDPYTTEEVEESRFFRRQQGFFMQVKWDEDEDPMPESNISSENKKSCAQAADYAGMLFCARIFDRAGIQFSPSYSLWGPEFICVVRRLTCDMDSYALGMDPTVKLNPGSTFHGSNYPQFTVDLGGPVNQSKQITRKTFGYPVWTSLPLIGRGTAVWRCEDGNLLKVAWRKQGRSREADIYQHIDIPGGMGIARLVDGGDVYTVMSRDGLPISTNFIRNVVVTENARRPVPHERNSILHRVWINPTGKSLYTFDSIIELVGGLQDIVQGLEYLTSAAVVHRDISPGNVYLWDTVINGKGPPSGMRGFVADLDFASLPPHQTVEVQRDTTPLGPFHPLLGFSILPGQSIDAVQLQQDSLPSPVHKKMRFTDEAGPPVIRNASPEMTGTIHFLAHEVLLELMKNGYSTLKREPHHDLESLCLVVIYSFYRRVISELQVKGPSRQLYNLQAAFDLTFGYHPVLGIINGRTGVRQVNLLADAVKELFGKRGFRVVYLCSHLIALQTRPFTLTKPVYTSDFDSDGDFERLSIPITHTKFIGKLNRISRMKV